MDITLIIFLGLLFVLIILALATASIVSAYNLMFSRYEKLLAGAKKDGKKIEIKPIDFEDERAEIRQNIEQMVGRESGEFQKMFLDIKKESQKLMMEILELSRADSKKELQEFRAMLLAKIEKELENAKVEVDTYKTERMKMIDSNINKILQSVAQEVLPEAVDMSTQEKLILQTLQRAKAENFF